MSNISRRVAGAPITWGVCEVPGWGHQLAPEQVLSEMARIGLRATELGPEGFLPQDPLRARALLSSYGLRLVGGFVPMILHSGTRFEEEIERTAAAARLLSELDAEVLVLAAASETTDYNRTRELTSDEWHTMIRSINEVMKIASEVGLIVALHPHYGTMIEGTDDVDRILEMSSVPLCLDTGHLALGGADPLDITRRARDRIAHVHLKDVAADLVDSVRAGELEYHAAVRRGLYRPLGRGAVPVSEIVLTLESHGYRGWYVLEQDAVLDVGPDSDESAPMQDAAESLAFLLEVMKEDRSEVAQ
jgi:inosose dehydratase